MALNQARATFAPRQNPEMSLLHLLYSWRVVTAVAVSTESLGCNLVIINFDFFAPTNWTQCSDCLADLDALYYFVISYMTIITDDTAAESARTAGLIVAVLATLIIAVVLLVGCITWGPALYKKFLPTKKFHTFRVRKRNRSDSSDPSSTV